MCGGLCSLSRVPAFIILAVERGTEVVKEMFMNRAVFVIIVSFLSCLGAQAVWAQTPDAGQRGQKVYTAEKCAVCHSIGGTGNKKGPLDGVGAKLTADQIRQWIVNAPEMSVQAKAVRKPAMKAYPNIAKEDLDGLVAYLGSLKK